jgi:hypothetical protein
MIKLGLSELQQVVQTVTVQTEAEDRALATALLAHVRDPQKGLVKFQFRERAAWRHVKTVLKRAREAAD